MSAVVFSAALVAIAGIHVTWALGLWWPLGDETRLARAVVGTRGITRMPGPVPCALVAVALMFGAAWPWIAGGWLWWAGTAALALVFLGRGAASYVPAMRSLAPEEPFATLDRTWYAPLCLTLGALAVLILLRGAP